MLTLSTTTVLHTPFTAASGNAFDMLSLLLSQVSVLYLPFFSKILQIIITGFQLNAYPVISCFLVFAFFPAFCATVCCGCLYSTSRPQRRHVMQSTGSATRCLMPQKNSKKKSKSTTQTLRVEIKLISLP